MIDITELNHKKHSPQKLYNRLIKLNDMLPEMQLILNKIIQKCDSTEDLGEVHEALYVAYIKCRYILSFQTRMMVSKK